MKATPILVIALLLLAVWMLSNTSSGQLQARDISPDHDVVMFAAEWCGYCDQARAWLEQNEVHFLEIDIDSSVEAQRQWREAGGRGVPLTFIGDQRMAGFSPAAYGQALEQL
jgi:glutaredoxin